MNILTPTEISECLTGGLTAVVRAIEAAMVKRLAEGVSVEPTLYRDATGNVWDGVDLRHDEDCTQLFTADQLTTAIAAARVQENERCAKRVIETKEWRGKGWQGMLCHDTKQAIAIGIRALLGKESKTSL